MMAEPNRIRDWVAMSPIPLAGMLFLRCAEPWSVAIQSRLAASTSARRASLDAQLKVVLRKGPALNSRGQRRSASDQGMKTAYSAIQ
jgi:hypothetical protein